MTAKPKDAAWVLRMGRHGVQVLAVVLVLALVFTMVNVQQFAAQGHPSFGVQWFIAWLLDPMASLTMAAAIVYEGLLADYGKPKVHWLTATKWYAGVATWGMNIWSSAAAGSFAGIWLHSVAPGLVLLLAEAAPRVRRHMADIIDELERELTAPPVESAPVIELPTPTYARVGLSSWTAPAAPAWRSAGPGSVVGPQPSAAPEPVVDRPAVAPEPVEQPVSEPVAGVARRGGERIEAGSPAGDPAPKPEPAGVLEQGPRVSGHELDALISEILTLPGNADMGRRRITELLPDPKPSDHAVKTALARVRARAQPVLNGARVPAQPGSTDGPSDG